jgi:hypothetical protein
MLNPFKERMDEDQEKSIWLNQQLKRKLEDQALYNYELGDSDE